MIKPVDDLDLMNRWASTTRTFWACNSISAGVPGDPFRVLAGGDITLHAGSSATFRSDAAVEEDASLTMLAGPVPGCP